MSNWKMNIIDGKSYLLLEVIVRKVKGSWNSSERETERVIIYRKAITGGVFFYLEIDTEE